MPSGGGSAEIIDKTVFLDIPVTIGSVTLSGSGNGGTIYADGGSLTVTNRLEITNGALTQPMTVTISATATLRLSGGSRVSSGVTINNAGRIEWSGGPVYFDGTLNNSGLFVIFGDAGFGSADDKRYADQPPFYKQIERRSARST